MSEPQTRKQAQAQIKPPLLILVGPTAVGKTALSLQLAERFNCEIISGDSMQVYRGMDIGTAKASPQERAAVPHHLIDIREPHEPFSVSDFHKLATATIADIHRRGKLPFIVGGTGLYIQSVCYNYSYDDSGADDEIRGRWRAYALEHGAQALHDRLREVDPATADRLHPNDQRRIIRALEIAETSGSTLAEQLERQTRVSPYDCLFIGLTMEREQLYKRIGQRVDLMMSEGLVAEAEELLQRGVDQTATAMQAIGYKEMAAYLAGRLELSEAVELIKRDSRRFAKRQLSWFRRMNEIEWTDMSEPLNFYEKLQAINDIIAGKFRVHTEYTLKRC